MKSLEYDETNYFHLRFALHVAGTSKCTSSKLNNIDNQTLYYTMVQIW